MPDSTWIGSIDVNDWVQKLMDREVKQISIQSAKQMTQLTNTEKTLQNKVNGYGQLWSLCATMQANLQALSTAFNPTYNVSSSNNSVATATVDSTSGTNVSAASHTLLVSQLAQAESVASTTIFPSATNGANLSEILNLSVGSSNFNLTVNTGDSLQTIANNINIGATANNVGVTASVISTGSGQYQLVISSTQTGVANEVAISESGAGPMLNIATGPGAGGTGGTGNVLTQAADALFKFDGLSFDVPSNTNILIEGLNISLLSAGTPLSPLSVNLAVSATNPVSTASAAVQSVITAYNAVDLFIEQTQANNPPPDPTLSLILTNLQTTIASALGGSSQYQHLSDVGIVSNPNPDSVTITLANGMEGKMTPTGQLLINTDSTQGPTLSNALTTNFSAVQALLSGPTGLFTTINTALNSGTGQIWKTLNDPNMGGTALGDKQISQIHKQIGDEKARVEQLKKDLVLKYAKLDLVLSDLQSKSQYLSAQIATLGGGNH